MKDPDIGCDSEDAGTNVEDTESDAENQIIHIFILTCAQCENPCFWHCHTQIKS